MAQLQLKSSQFRKEREHIWTALEKLIKKIETSGVKSLTDQEITDLPVYYRSTLSSLSVAREISLDQSVVAYLESLSARAYYLVYGTRTTLSKRIASFFVKYWPQAVAKLWRETLGASFCFFGAGLIAYMLVMSNMDWFYSLTPNGLVGDRTPTASTEYLKSTLYDDYGGSGLGIFAAKLLSNNAGVAITAFALGFALCLPTIALMAYNGFAIGAFIALFASRGLGVDVMGWLSIHGTTEIFAIVLGGAAGFHIGLAAAFPKNRARLEAVVEAGKTGSIVVGGVVIMMLVAGLLEGYGRQLISSTAIRFSVGGVMLFLWCFYFYAYGRQDIELER